MSVNSMSVGLVGGALVPYVGGGAITWVKAKSGTAALAIVSALAASTIAPELWAKAKVAAESVMENGADAASWETIIDIGKKAGGMAGRIADAISKDLPVVQVPLAPTWIRTVRMYVDSIAALLGISHDRALDFLILMGQASKAGVTSDVLSQYQMLRESLED